MVGLHGLQSVLLELLTLSGMEASDAAARSRRLRSADRSAHLAIRAAYLTRAADALAQAADEARCAAEVTAKHLLNAAMAAERIPL